MTLYGTTRGRYSVPSACGDSGVLCARPALPGAAYSWLYYRKPVTRPSAGGLPWRNGMSQAFTWW